MKGVQTVLKVGVIAIVSLHLALSPYTKVEESFNLQAIHDILNYGVLPFSNIDSYDHKSFPGVVPRTFIGALLVSGVVSPIIKALKWVGVADLLSGDQHKLQLLVRFVIGLANAASLIKLCSCVDSIDFKAKKARKSPLAGSMYLLLLLSQFHLLYYASRTLPNFLALPFVNYAIGKLITGDVSGLTWLAFTGIVFRLEICVFAGVVGLVSVLFRQIHLFVAILALTLGAMSGAVLSLAIDSKFWGYYLIPELVSLKYNVFEGKSVNWGVEPASAYFFKYIPKLFKPPVVVMLSVVGLVSDPAEDGKVFRSRDNAVVHRPSVNSLRILYVSAVVFVGIMSLQPHKEWRFIIYIAPIFTLLAGNGFANLIRKPGFMNKVLVLIFLVLTGLAGVISLFMGYISSYNYPGGLAMQLVNSHIASGELAPKDGKSVLVHMDVATCMTGATRFGELHSDMVIYDKTETSDDWDSIWNNIDILVTEHKINAAEWETIFIVPIFHKISLYPVMWHILQYHDRPPKQVIRQLLFSAGRVVRDRDWESVKTLLDLPISTKESLYVYRRKAIEAEPNVSQAPETVPKSSSETVGTAVESLASEDIDIDAVAEDVNSQIDQLESEKLVQ